MSGFKALNIESDDESDIEVDDSKEIQIEDALKLYQSALRYHAEGPPSFDQAAEAYRQLFESEIFRYPESQAELRRIELYGPLVETDDLVDEHLGSGPAVVTNSLDSGPSTLPQILHLSHKNYAQFKLEALTARFEQFNTTLSQILADATTALNHFVEALDKDDTDLDLWRKTAAVGEVLSSKRVARFCLEAVLDGDDEGIDSIFSLPGLEEGFAGERLRELVGELADRLSLLQAPLSVGKRRVLSRMLKQRLLPYEDVLARGKALRQPEPAHKEQLPNPQRMILRAPTSWAELGDTLLRQLMAEQHGPGPGAPSTAISFDLTSLPPISEPVDHSQLFAEASVSPNVHPPEFAMGSSNTVMEQFPGLDHGSPTVQPEIAAADASMQPVSRPPEASEVDMVESPTMTLPTRKRSGDAAGLNDTTEEGRAKSKRLRARDSVPESVEGRQALIDANVRWEYEQQLNEFQAADDWVFETVASMFERIGVIGFEAGKNVRHELDVSSTELNGVVNRDDVSKHNMRLVRADVSAFLNNYSEQLAHLLLVGGENLDIGQSPTAAGLAGAVVGSAGSKPYNAFQPVPNDGIRALLTSINDRWMQTRQVAFEFTRALLQPSDVYSTDSTYLRYLWPENLKTIIVRTLVNFDEAIFGHIEEELEKLSQGSTGAASGTCVGAAKVAALSQTIFELHLDIYCLIKQPNSGVDSQTVTAQGDRLQRWAEIAREAMHLRSTVCGTLELRDELSLRFLWATTFCIGASTGITQDHVIECMQDLRRIFVAAGEPKLYLQNNAVMPELSLPALDRELSRLTTKDFFLKITDQDLRDPVAVIESLEPLLDAVDDSDCIHAASDSEASAPGALPELVRFLRSSNISVRLLLWQRLRDAYLTIDYRPMVVSSYFRMIQIVLSELKTTNFSGMPQVERQAATLKCLRVIQDMIMKCMIIVQSSHDAFDCIDDDRLKSAVGALGEVLHFLQVFSVNEDSLRIGKTQPPSLPNGMPVPSFAAMNDFIHVMQIHTWIVLYELFKEATAQNPELYATPLEDRFDFLRCLHRNLGLRGICGSANRLFVRILKDEFFQMTRVDGYDSEQSQVLYDLYGLNCFLNPSYELIEHHCTHDAFLDRSVAMHAVDLLLAQADKLPMKELIKHPLKDTIDKVHGTIARKKPTEAIMRNREIYRSFLRSPIHPVDMYLCLKGEGNQLPVSPIPKSDALLASKGWYFLMGHIALTKFRSQKRTAPTPTEDVDIAIAFFMQDLEYSMDNWETWFRLAQAYDTKIEEGAVWSAEKLNNSMLEIVQLQRAAIHCYTMATALAYRSADLAFETSSKMTELYLEFAMRLYASSREPFNMLPFALDDLEKFLSLNTGMGKGKPFQPLRVYTAWKLAKTLLQRALVGRPQQWTLHFMLGKCSWKMYAASPQIRGRDRPPTTEQVIDSFVKAIELVPKQKDSRDTKRDPLLEPHYKLVSIVHKMVSRGDLDLQQAGAVLRHTPYARLVTYPQDMDGWVPHVLAILKNLRSADKSNWYHRIIARTARVVYDYADPRASTDEMSHSSGEAGAKHELTQQMFTKTMVLQVWRPEGERAGRHFVYTARYTRFFVRILEQIKDRANLEQLARRVRRRPHDVFEHSLVWQDICSAYLKLLRSFAALPEGLETSTFSSIAHEDFIARKEPLEKWMQMQESGGSATLDVLREVQELKKINQSLMKPGPIDDLIGDAYAYLFNTVGRQLYEEERKAQLEEQARQVPAVMSPPRNPMMSLDRLMNLDGTNEPIVKPEPIANDQSITAQGLVQAEVPGRRKIGVGRREIRTCAEACFKKAIGNHKDSDSTKLSAPSNVRVEVVIKANREGWAGDASAETSAPGSIHDSADDESELSELEEEGEDIEGDEPEEDDQAPPRPLFPGLADRDDSHEVLEGFETAEEEPARMAEDVDMSGQDDVSSSPPVAAQRSQ